MFPVVVGFYPVTAGTENAAFYDLCYHVVPVRQALDQVSDPITLERRVSMV